MDGLFDRACAKIDEEASELRTLSDAIWANPELNFKEKVCHQILTDFLEKKGFKVERNYILDTAFRAEFGKDLDSGGDSLPHVMVICEYDALPEIGHACGHNLIAEVGVATGLGVKAAMEAAGGLRGKLTVLGTPAEEGGGGKAYLIEAGAFAGVHAALMSHPCSFDNATPQMLANNMLNVTFHGKATHAAAAPWQGVNALDAAVHAYTGISHLRQQLRPSARVHGIITNGGAKANVIPELTAMEYNIREDTKEHLEALCGRVEDVFRAAARATGCSVDVVWTGKPYEDMISNHVIADIFTRHVTKVQPDWGSHTKGIELKGSSDMGNVSHVVPSLHPLYYIGDAMNHTRPFTELAASDQAQGYTLNQAKALAMTCVQLMGDAGTMARSQEEFAAQKRAVNKE